MNTVTFPGLGLEFVLNRVAITVLGHPIYWYGIIIATGFLLAALYCQHRAPELGVDRDKTVDFLIFAVPLSILGARVYYILFYLDMFRKADGTLDFMQMVRIWDGGLAIYGAVITAVVACIVFTKVHKLNFWAYADWGSFGLLIGQAVGRWGNFFNVEAYGGPTDLPWRMGVYQVVNGTYEYVEVHPTFFYESMWNVLGLCLLIFLSKKGRRKFDGMLILTYVAWYGLGRGVIEGLRSDSLYFFGLEFFGMPIRTSQMLGFASSAVAVAILAYRLLGKKYSEEGLYVNRLKAAQATTPAPGNVALVAVEDGDAQAFLTEHKERCTAQGVYCESYLLPANTPQEEVVALVDDLCQRTDVTAVYVYPTDHAAAAQIPADKQ